MNAVARSAAGTLLAALLAGGCGDGARRRAAEPGPYVAQEVWITYHDPRYQEFGVRTGRTREEARALAEDLRARALAGEDVGDLARRHSNAPGGLALGFSDWRARDPERMDVRDRALVRTPIGEVTPLEEWLGGWWFARRVPEARGRELEALFQRLHRLRARIRAVAVVWDGAWGLQEDDRAGRTRDVARARAEEALAAALGGTDFAEVARTWSDDQGSRERGGLVVVKGADGQPTEWIRPNEPWLVEGVLQAAFEGEVGRVWPRVIESERGYFVVRVEERREEAAGGSAAGAGK